MATRSKTSASNDQPAAPDIPMAEWIAGGIGLLLVASTVGGLVYGALTQEDRPPDIQVEVLSVVPVKKGYLARFRATNHGDQAAGDVHIRGVHGEGPQAEESETVVDFLPAHSEKSGGLFFIHEPSAVSLSVRATGYQEP